MPTQCRIRLTFSPHSKIQQAIYEYIKEEPSLVMMALIDRYSFLALAKNDYPEKELVNALIESNAALMKAIEINNAIAARQGITMATNVTSARQEQSLSSKPLLETGDDWDDDDLPKPPKKPSKIMSDKEKANQEVLSRL
jgi:hypothetical protein